jgi:hypothetical protein
MRIGLAGRGLGVVAVLLVAAAMPVAAQQDQKMSPEEQAAWEAWMKYAAPGPQHKLLEPFVGSWNVATTMWSVPGAPPMTSTGTSEVAWVLGGRYIQEKVKGEMMGQPFEGMGCTGYDNFKKRFVGTWMDTMGTMMLTSTGEADSTGKVFTYSSTMDDVVSGKPMTVREVVRVVDHDKHVFEMYGPDPSGKEFKTLEMVYTRK